ncbi:MAG: hypothetical protein Q8N13_20745 [Acidovorax sp.]|nr:hypothetical protein [Acidovorax sp.]
MALIKALTHQPINGASPHREVDCTYSIISNADGSKSLQLDTYGSKTRKIPGKKSQSLRFDNGALAALKKIIAENNL